MLIINHSMMSHTNQVINLNKWNKKEKEAKKIPVCVFSVCFFLFFKISTWCD